MRIAARLSFPYLAPPCHARAAGMRMDDAMVAAMLASAERLAQPVAVIDELLRPRRSARVRERLRHLHRGRTDGSAELRAIWFARIAREGFRLMLLLGFREAVFRRVHVVGPAPVKGSCVYAVYHTPWGRVLAAWTARRSGSVIFSAQRWLDRAGKAHVPCTWRGQRDLLRRMKAGSSAAVTSDHFDSRVDRSVATSILGREVRVSTGMARIASAAGVPIVPVTIRYRAGKLEMTFRREISVSETSVADATRRVTAVFDAELRRDPSSWEQAHRFLSAVR